MKSLNEKNSHALLLFLFEQDKPVNKSELSNIIKNPYKLTDLLEILSKDDLIIVNYSKLGKISYEISLTTKGRSVAEQLKRAEEISQGKSFTFPDKFAIISFLSGSGPVTLSQLKERYPDALDIIREFESMKVIRQEIDNSKHPLVNRIALTEKGEKIAEHLQKIDEILKR